MTGINPIALTKVATGSNGAQALAGSSTSGVLAGAGIGGNTAANFWELILSHITAPENQESIKTAISAEDVLTSDKAPAQNNNPLAMLQVALAAQNVDEQGNIVLAQTPEDADKLQTQLDLTNKIINHLKNALPEQAEKDGLFNQILSKLQAKSDTLQASLSALENGVITKDTPVEDIPMPLLVALGLNPAEITEVTDKIQDIEKKLGRDITVEDLIAGVGGIIPPAPETATLAVSSLNSQKASVGVIDTDGQPTDELAAQLNALDVGGEDLKDATAKKETGNAQTPLMKDIAAPKSGDIPVEGYKGNAEKTDTTLSPKEMAKFKDNLVNMLNNNNAQHGTMNFTTPIKSETDSLLFQPQGLTPTLPTYTSAGTAANVITTPATAGQMHPATQMVAATITNSAKNGNDNIMTLRMDPPELGNVNIRLQFGKDKTVKAHILVEKSDTYTMLQRDQQTLERALHSAGLDANADSISFELAQDNSAFQHNNNGEGGSEKNFGNGNAGTQDADMADIIQSSVTWQVDPSTGQVRYNIFA